MGSGLSQDLGRGLSPCPKSVGTARSQPECSAHPSASQGHSHCPLEPRSGQFMTQLPTEFPQEVPLCKPHLPKSVPSVKGQQKDRVFPRSL